MLNLETWDQVVDGQYAIVGSPETVTDMLVENLGRLGTGNLLGLFQLGTLPHDLTKKNLGLFADQVMPKLRAEFPEGQPVFRPSAGGWPPNWRLAIPSASPSSCWSTRSGSTSRVSR